MNSCFYSFNAIYHRFTGTIKYIYFSVHPLITYTKQLLIQALDVSLKVQRQVPLIALRTKIDLLRQMHLAWRRKMHRELVIARIQAHEEMVILDLRHLMKPGFVLVTDNWH